jgi:uncharacterized protein YegL
MEQTPFGEPDLAKNPEPRCPCLLLLDVSASMGGRAIAELNAGLVTFKDELAADALAAKRVEVAVVTFGGTVQTLCDFTTADLFTPPTLVANGETPMGAAIEVGLDLVQTRKEVYRTNGLGYFRPWVFMITDGAPTDPWQGAAERVRQSETAKALSFFAVGVENANFDVLNQISVRKAVKLDGLRFRDLFVWLSASQKSVSRSKAGETVDLPPCDCGSVAT